MDSSRLLIWSALATVGAGAASAVLFMRPINGTRRWFGVGGFGVQPSELAKLAAIFFTAALLERRMHRVDEVRYSLLPIGLVVGGIAALVLIEPDFGTAVSIAAGRRADGVRRRARLKYATLLPWWRSCRMPVLAAS